MKKYSILLLFLLFSFLLQLAFCSPCRTFQPWRNLEAIPPLRLTGSHSTRSIMLCLFQLKPTPLAVRRIVIPWRNTTHLYHTHCPGVGFSVSGYVLCCYKRIYADRWLTKSWTAVGKYSVPCGKMHFTQSIHCGKGSYLK